MKRVLLFLAFLTAGSFCRAADPTSILPGRPESFYTYTNGSIAVSSITLSTFPVVMGYRQITLAPSTSFFYVLDGTSSTQTVVNNGYVALAAGTTPNADIVIESNQQVGITLPAGVASTNLRFIIKQK